MATIRNQMATVHNQADSTYGLATFFANPGTVVRPFCPIWGEKVLSPPGEKQAAKTADPGGVGGGGGGP